jgi:hypothetical protein
MSSDAPEGADLEPALPSADNDDFATSLVHDRLSATPVEHDHECGHHHHHGPIEHPPWVAAKPFLPARQRAAQAITGPLPSLQRWFATLMMAPGEVRDALPQAASVSGLSDELLTCDDDDLARVLTHGPRSTASDRLNVYRQSYFARLIECVADDYPALQYMLGEDGFAELAQAYVEKYPSRNPNLNYYSRHLATFLRESQPPTSQPRELCADLAELEWAMVEVLHAPAAEAIDLAHLQTYPFEKWASACFHRADTARILRFAYPVNRFYQAFRNDEGPAAPEAGTSATAVYRQGQTIWRMDLTPGMCGLLETLFGGASLGEALGTLQLPEDPAAMTKLLENAMVWFREWVSGGLFGAITVEE